MKGNRLGSLVLFFCAITLVLLVFLWSRHLKKMESLRAAALVVRESFIQPMIQSPVVVPESQSNGVSVVSTSVLEKKKEISDLIVKKNLSVPFTTQAPESNWDQPWQDACEEAAIVMLQAYYGKIGLSVSSSKELILKIMDREKELGWGGSIEIEKIKQLAEEFVGREFVIKENPSIEDLRMMILDGHPILVVADGKNLPNPFFKNGGPIYHALVVRGFTEEGFITNDPGTRFGENFFYNNSGLLDNIHNWNGGDVSRGGMVVLVVK